MSKNKDARWIGELDDAIGFPKIAEDNRRILIQEPQDRVPRNHETQRFLGYLP